MKRSLVTTLIIGVIVAGVVSALHASRLLLRLETVVAGLVSNYASASKIVGDKWQYVFVLLLALGVAWLRLTSVSQKRARLLVVLFLVELLGLSWVCSLYHIFFEPLPPILAVVLGLAATEGWIAFSRRDRSRLSPALFASRLSREELRRIRRGTISVDAQPKTHQVSVVACDIANKYALVADSEPSIFAKTAEAFIQYARDHLLQAGAYLQAADGEGVVAIFGFPASRAEHAERAVSVALDLVEDFRKRQNDGELPCDIQFGISSGEILAAPSEYPGKPALLTSGEPIELARRFCSANNVYGSRILIGTRTFDLASQSIVARPIDFVKGVNGQDRHEIYEPLWQAAEVEPEHMKRRDSFWAGVVLYREKRWAEAYTEFQKARGSEQENDPPLQFYLRRLEALALHLMEASPD